ncbi:hypothetical protein [Rhizobium leguminosarum]|uniref:hypothetical protein n=1 Tax=Rhizobium leguminosarum TaxID=384 RepID=UPI001F353106|nr:hypothetical protein [Rhizobium leguminosarum]UIJ83142.1 hypothetical protein LZK78_32175 [Rhizobium leguminosarum]
MFDKKSNYDEMIGASKALGKVIREIRAAWLEAFGTEMVVGGATPSARFDDLLAQLRAKWAGKRDRERLIEALDIEELGTAASDIEHVVEFVSDTTFLRNVDDLTPNQVLSAMAAVAWDESSDDGAIEVELASFLRIVIKRIFGDNNLKGRINIGTNRHFPRLYQWLTEYAEQTAWEGGSGLKIRNLSGRGRVARHPRDPKLLKVVINRAFL